MNTKGYCLDETQALVEIEAYKDKNSWIISEAQDASLLGKRLAEEFFHKTTDAAVAEVEDRHRRLNIAFKSLDLVGCLSIHKESERKFQGRTKEELKQLAKDDKEHYREWLENLEKSWTKINKGQPDLEKLAKTLRNHALVQEALSEPLAIDFIEIMAEEARIKKSREKNTPEM